MITKEMYKGIKEAYDAAMPQILAGERFDPYGIWPHDWVRYMSPIEVVYWGHIRGEGMRGWFPQVPCGPFFIDFANPRTGEAVELDGKAFHMEKAKDAARQKYIMEHGYPHFKRY